MPPAPTPAPLRLRLQRLHPQAVLPARAHAQDAGLDLVALSVAQTAPRVFAFDTGWALQPPPGYYCEVAARSGIVKLEFILANGVGIIDPGYRGPLLVFLRYLGANQEEGPAQANALAGTRIAQLLLRSLPTVLVEETTSLDPTPRGTGRTGSSGKAPL